MPTPDNTGHQPDPGIAPIGHQLPDATDPADLSLLEPRLPVAELVNTDGLSPRQVAFLRAFIATGGNVSRAAASAGVRRQTHYDWLEKPEYARAVNEARGAANDRLEGEADRRAVEGVLEPIYHKGQKVGSVRKYSDRLLITRLRAEMPEKYADRRFVSSSVEGRFAHLRLSADVEPGATDADVREIAKSMVRSFVERVRTDNEDAPVIEATVVEG